MLFLLIILLLIKEIQLQHVVSSDNLAADLLTKVLPKVAFLRHAASLLHGS